MKIENLVYKMLTTSTGIALMDSGGDDGRAWQRNIKRTLKDFENDPEVELDSWRKRIDYIARRVDIQLHHNFNGGIVK
jgi:hypothetical protein